MTPERWKQVSAIYDAALARHSDERADYVAEACAGDTTLRHEVQSLLDQTSSPQPDRLTSVVRQVMRDGLAPPLTGRRFGDYLVGERIDSGGMGDVYRARDTRLGRDVAIKVLQPEFADDPDRLARFEREARLLASLDHPHIGTIYGIEEDSNGTRALVLAFVEGETLAARLRRGSVPIAEALEYARQIADALEAAHDRGIVHRDLKPGNIKITPAGIVKVLDFGLARAATDADAIGAVSEHSGDGLTRTGVVMGTAAYMSPEQARGDKVDKRTDVWAFGCVLFEMLTGRPAFARETAADTVAAILHEEPPWDALPPETTPAVRTVIERCLRKNLKERLRDVGDVQLALSGAFTPASNPPALEPSPPTPAPPPRPVWRRASPAIALLAIGGLVTAAALWLGRAPDTAQPVTRLSLATRGETAFFVNGNGRDLTITPDGMRVVYVGNGGRQIFVRGLDQLDPIAIVATPLGAQNPFVSPDGQWVGYGEGGLLKRVPIGGGRGLTVARLVFGFVRGAVWLPDNTIVFATNSQRGLLRVSADGGEPTSLTIPSDARNEYAHLWPEILPDGRSLLFTVFPLRGGLVAAKTVLYDLESHTATDLLPEGTNAVYLSSGHLAYIAGGSLSAIPFDVERRMTMGPPVQVLKQIVTTGNGAGDFAVSSRGTLVYAHASGYDAFARTLSWIDRQGRREPLAVPSHPYSQFRLSHDGTRVVTLGDREPEQNVWVLDLSRHFLTRVTTGAALDIQPAWTWDDRWIVFVSNREGGTQNLWRVAADGTGAPERLTHPPTIQAAGPSPAPNGRLLFTGSSDARDSDLMEMTLDDRRQVRPLVRTSFNEGQGTVSPDALWLAYNSNRSGRAEVYVAPYPNTDAGRWQVSTAGGLGPRWSKDGKEIFFLGPDRALMSVKVTGTGNEWSATPPTKVLEPGYWSSASVGVHYDVSPDGKRLLVLEPPTLSTPDLVVVQQWDEELKALVPSR